jgi:hypothetical protein
VQLGMTVSAVVVVVFAVVALVGYAIDRGVGRLEP